MDNAEAVKQKKEYSQLPPSILERTLKQTEGDIKKARAHLRKYYGIFLTNKVLKGNTPEVLKQHHSSKERDYHTFYTTLQKTTGPLATILDLGAGANAYSLPLLKAVYPKVTYIGVEAAGQLITNTQGYITKEHIPHATMIHGDLLDTTLIETLLKKKMKKPRAVFLLQVVDALEQEKRNSTKQLLLDLSPHVEYIIISLPKRSIGGRTAFHVNRKWLTTFTEEQFKTLLDTSIGNERVLILETKK